MTEPMSPERLEEIVANLAGTVRSKGPIFREAQELLAETKRAREQEAFLRKALEQAVGYGVAPSLPTLPELDLYLDRYEDMVDANDEWEMACRRVVPFGDDTVAFYGADECDYPYNCPELAEFLRSASPASVEGVSE